MPRVGRRGFSVPTDRPGAVATLIRGANSVERRGLTCDVYRIADGTDFSNQGITSRATEIVLTGPGVPRISAPDERRPELVLVTRHGVLVARPATERPPGHAGWMFGGNFIYSSDGRFPTPHQAIPVHDRSEPFPERPLE